MGSRTEKFDVIVIGGGIMGSATAYQTAKRDRKTLVLEQFGPVHRRGSSHGESRTIHFTHPNDYYRDMILESDKLWRQAESEAGYKKVRTRKRHLDMGPENDARLQAVIASCQKNSNSFVPPKNKKRKRKRNNLFAFQKLNPREVADKFSGRLSIPENWTAVLTKFGSVIEPTKAVLMFRELAIGRGAVWKDNMEVKHIKRDKDRGGIVVRTATGEKFRGEKCVVTAGAWTKKLVHSITRQELPIQPVETAVWYWRINEGHEEHAIGGDFPTFTSYGRPYIYGNSSLEFPGLIKIVEHGGWPCEPDKRRWMSGGDPDSLKEWIEGRFPGLLDCSTHARKESCMYSMTPDGDFVLDFLGGKFRKDVVIGGGFSGHGFKMAPAIGRILADLALVGSANGVELKHFRIKRFDKNPKGNMQEFEEDDINVSADKFIAKTHRQFRKERKEDFGATPFTME